MSLIQLRNITKTYSTGKVFFQALRGVSLDIEQGEFVAIVGPSGSGKSTLLHLLSFLDVADGGQYVLMGEDISRLPDNDLAVLRNRLAGFVFQQFHLLSRLTSVENVELPLLYGGRKHLRSEARTRLGAVGLAARERNRPNELSGGEQQRVAIARALVNDPHIIFADEPTGNLDSKSEEEILRILEQLNAKGKTVVVVTHEPEVAVRAGRIITMRDGLIVSDERKKHDRYEVTKESLPSLRKVLSGGGSLVNRANMMDHALQALKTMVVHKVRSFLSVLGILIGVAAVITMIGLGEGAKASMAEQLSSLGSNLLTVSPGSRHIGGVMLEAGAVTRFTLKDAEKMADVMHVKNTSSLVRGRVQLVANGKNWNSQTYGVGVDYAAMHAVTPSFGAFFSEESVKARERVAVIGPTVAKELFGDKDPVGSIVKINRIGFSVIGVLPARGMAGPQDQDDMVLVPITTAMFRLFGKEYVDSIEVQVKDDKSIAAVQEDLGALIRKAHRLKEDDAHSFQIRDMSEIRKTLENMTKTMSTLLGFIAAISLLVGGIGIMNIMLVSVAERTREVGLRKAIGAKTNDILWQFLIESIVLTLVGGCGGILLGVAVSWILAVASGWAVKVSVISMVAAFSVSLLIGVIFGVWPAKQAAELDPITALRHE